MSFNTPIFIQWNDKGQLIENELKVITTNGITVLEQVPDKVYKVYIEDMIEVKNENPITNPNQYKCDYRTGTLYFHVSKVGQQINIRKYLGRGIIMYPASRIYDSNTGEPVNTTKSLQDYINSVLPFGDKGDFDPNASYDPNSIVSYEQGIYRCKQKAIGIIPTNTTYWHCMASVKNEASYAKAQGDYAKSSADGILFTSEDFTPETITIDNDIAPLVKSELNRIDSQFADITKRLSYPEKQAFLYANVYKKLRTDQNIIVECIGDSLTYGHDTVSADIRPIDPTITPNGEPHYFTRASKTYPEALSEFLNSVFANKITVINRGYSGDGTQLAYNRWITTVNSDVTLINLGTNDSMASHIPYAGDIDQFLFWYRKLIERQLNRNSAVIILTPPKARNTTDPTVDIFSNALINLGKEYNIPVIISDEMLANYDTDIYSDGTHFNGKGYTILGAKVAALFIGEGCTCPKVVSNGSKLLTRNTLDNAKATNATILNISGAQTPDETTVDQGIYAQLTAGSNITYSIYTDTEDLICMFNMATMGKYKLELDFGVEQGNYSLDYAVGNIVATTSKPASIINVTTEATEYLWSNNITPSKTNAYFHIATKGWHTIRVTCVTNSIAFNGLDFIDYRAFYSYTTIKDFIVKSFMPTRIPSTAWGTPSGDYAQTTNAGYKTRYLFVPSYVKSQGIRLRRLDNGAYYTLSTSAVSDGTLALLETNKFAYYQFDTNQDLLWISIPNGTSVTWDSDLYKLEIV